jgi:hypothetical protein
MSSVPEPETLLFETSPHGTLDSMVQQDGRTVYLYLHSPKNPEFGTRAVWVRNLIKGPLVLSDADLQMGIAPVLPRTWSAEPAGSPLPDVDQLRLIWFEEGNGVALLEGDEVLAIIPPWSGLENFHGYARDCRLENSICWPMPQQRHLTMRIRRAENYWRSWETGNPFRKLQEDLLAAYGTRFGEAGKYFAIDSGHWPPKAIQCFQKGGLLTALTVGVCVRSMPNVELAMENPSIARRVEFGIQLNIGEMDANAESILEWMSRITNYPWHRLTWFGHGHTSALPAAILPEYAGVFYFQDQQGNSALDLGTFEGDPINLLWMVPIDDEELKSIVEKTTSAVEFSDLLRKQNRLPSQFN